MIYVAFIIAVLTLVFSMTLASLAWQDLVTGFVFASALLLVFRRFVVPDPLPDDRFVLRALLNFPRLFVMVVEEIFRSTWLVATIVVGLRPLAHPGILKVPMYDHSEHAVAIVAFLVTLTPGSFVIAFDWDERVMLIHYVDISDPDQLRAHVNRYFWLWEPSIAHRNLPPDSTEGAT